MSAVLLRVDFAMGNGTPQPSLTSLSAAFERAGAEVADVAKHIYPKLAPALEAAVDRQFEARGAGPQQGAWAPLSKDYAAWKEQHYPGMPLLELTGAMRAALTVSTDPKALRSISGQEFDFGTKGVPYASYHQTGAPRLPARPPFDFGADFADAMTKVAAAGIREAIKEAVQGAWDELADFQGEEFEGQQVEVGKRGGAFVRTGARGRTYLKQTKDGSVVKKREFKAATKKALTARTKR